MQFSPAIYWLCNRFAFLLVPLIAVTATFALVYSQRAQFVDADPEPLAFSILGDAQATLDPQNALQRIAQQPITEQYDTKRAEHGFWLLISLEEIAPERSSIAFPSRHLRSVECRDAQTLESLGAANRNATRGAFDTAKAGYALHLAQSKVRPAALLCHARLAGPAQITVQSWIPSQLISSERRYHVAAGLLEGGLLLLAFFTLVMALINREARYFLLAIWLILNLRLASLTLGWDVQWLGFAIPAEFIVPMRKVTIAAYYLVTCLLQYQYFRNDLAKLRYGWALQVAIVAGFVLMLLALILPFPSFLPVMWVIATFGISTIIVLLTGIFRQHPTRSVIYFSAAMTFALLALFIEVVASAFGWPFLSSLFNSVTAAIASSVLVTLALSEQMRREKEERARTEEALNRTYDSAPIGLFTMDPEGRLLRINPAMSQMLEISGEAPLGKIQDWFDELDLGELRSIATRSGGGETELHRSSASQGLTKHWYLTKVIEANGKIEGSLQDITERIEATEQLRYMANHDSLTGLLNRRGITQELENAVYGAGRGRAASLIYLNLNRFKLVNDLYRNQTGDHILKLVGERVQKELPPDSRLGRLGGDEFLVVMPNLLVSDSRPIAERIVDSVNTLPYKYGQQVMKIEGRMGLIDVIGTMTTTTAISTAQRACNDAKRTGAPLVTFDADAEVHQERLEELHLIKLMGGETLPRGLNLFMQPILSLRAPEKSLNFEILLRFKDAGGRMVPIPRILNAALASGNMARLDKWVLTETLRWLQANHRLIPNTRFVAVNLSGTSLNDQAFLEDLIEILRTYQSVVHYLCLEITEGVALNDLAYTNIFIEKLKECGATIALDDFGAGYTSFSYLRDLRADALKIDGAFVRSINDHPANIAIVASIVELAQNLGMRSIAEGVEDPTMLEILAEMGVDYVQGYAITRPQPLDDVTAVNSSANFMHEERMRSVIEKLAEVQRKLEHYKSGDGPLYH